jgi:hypothetical protein
VSLTLLYRGPLSSCNYGCEYCPFGKRRESPADHAADAAKLGRFLHWCEGHRAPLRVFFTPWGEALVHRRYQRALVALTHLGHVEKAAIQTNLSAGLDWLSEVDASRLGIWATFHPGWAKRSAFVARCRALLERSVSFSVGMVGLPQHLDELLALRAELPPQVYLWVNAVKALAPSYAAEVLKVFRRVDPHFDLNLAPHPSRGRACAGGHTVLSVDGEGLARSCHFVEEPLGNLYDGSLRRALGPRPCAAATCGCHIGYVHLEHLGLEEVYGGSILERVPVGWPTTAEPQRWGTEGA